MKQRTGNSQMFALAGKPPEQLIIQAAEYRLSHVFKHDFWAATCLYETDDPAAIFPRVVVKFGRSRPWLGLSLKWSAVKLANHEQVIYEQLVGIRGVPRWVARLSPTSYALEYLDAVPLDHLVTPPPGFFDRLREVFDAIHARGVAYGDANKKSNILVTTDGYPAVIDFQISLRRRDDWLWPGNVISRRMVEYLAGKDLYHLYKHKRRLSPEELTEDEDVLSRNRSGLHLLHRKLTKPYRNIRRKFLKKQFDKGRLVSPTAELEDHHQPEKETWRKRDS
jgi:hypothetical protein